MSKYTFNVNNFSINKNERFFAYINVIGANRIVKLLNEQEEQIHSLKEELKDYSNDNARLEEQIQELEKENEKIKGYNKSQELEIVRLHKLADAMSGVLKELGVYDVYDGEQINSVKEKLK